MKTIDVRTNEKLLYKLLRNHNSSSKGFKTSMNTLRKIYQRGMSYANRKGTDGPDAERMAVNRVKNFLYLMKNSKPAHPVYDYDNDLLPKKHPVICTWYDYLFTDRADAEEMAKILGFSGIHSTNMENQKYYIPGGNHQDIINLVKNEE